MKRKTGKAKRPASKRVTSATANRQTPKAMLLEVAQRASSLVLGYVALGRLTPELRRDVLRLKEDIETWRERTGSDDIRVTERAPTKPTGPTPQKAMMTTGGDDAPFCGCPPIEISLGRLCFLVDCEVHPSPGIIRWCSYVCIELPSLPWPFNIFG